MPTIHTGAGLSREKNPLLAAQEAVAQAKINLKQERIDLALIFSTIELSQVSLLKTLGPALQDTLIIGASSAAIISPEGIIKQGLVILLLSFPEGIFFNAARVKEIGAKTPEKAGYELGEKLLTGFQDIRRDLGILFSDGLIKDGAGLIHGLQEKLGTSFPLVGASASDNLQILKTSLYFNQDIFRNGICAIMLGGKLNFGLGIQHGWQPLGKPRRVTRSSGNAVYEIDGIAAIKLYEEYFAYSPEKLKQELKRISVFYPIGIYLAGEKEYLLRNVLAIQEDGSLVFQGDVPQNSEIRLMIGTKESCLSAAQEAVNEAKAAFLEHPINFVLVFDSISRYILLGREAQGEFTLLRKAIDKDIPIIGIYTNTEQAPLTAINYRGKAYLHNQAIAVLAIGG